VVSATGTLTTATMAAVAKAPKARRFFGSQDCAGFRTGCTGSAPSNLRIAASMASRLAAGRGGGGFGSETESSLSIAI